MSGKKPISTAPQDGTTVLVHWTDADGQQNESLARYRSLAQLRNAGGDWDESDAGWWISTDGNTRRRVEPHGWLPAGSEETD